MNRIIVIFFIIIGFSEEIFAIAAPTTQATGIVFSNLQPTQADISWTRGNGDNCAVFIRKTNAGAPAPVINTTYNANTVYAAGSQIGATGWYCIYNGTGTSVTVTGLSAVNTYRVMVCEYNTTGPAAIMYLSTTNGTNPLNFLIKNAQTITFGAIPAKVFGIANFSPGATASSGLAVSYSTSDPLVATIVANQIHIVGVGTCNIIASQAGNGSYYAAVNVIQSLTVNKANQTITFGALAAKTYGNAPYNLTATGGGSGNPITYISSDPLVATVAGITVTIVGAGTCTITASQAGNANYNAATDVPQTLTVNKVSQTITFNALAAKTYGNPTYTLSATGGASGNPITYSSSDLSVAIISGNTVTIVGAGTTIITASQAGNSNYSAAADKPQNQLVNKVNQTITFNALANKAYGSADFNLTATGGASGNSITYTSSNLSVATISGNTVTITGVGTTIITASQAGTSNYNAAADKTQNFTVIKGSQVITFGALAAKIYGDPPFNLTATGGGSGNPITYTSSNAAVATISGNTVTIVGAGSSNITALQAGNVNYNAAPNVVRSHTVSKASQTILFNPLPAKIFGDPSFALTATGGASGNPVTYTSSNTAVATISGTTVTIVGAGSTNITAAQLGNANYNAAPGVIQSLTVSKAAQTITFNPLPVKTFGNADFAPGATASSGLAVSYSTSDPLVATIVANKIHIIGVGSCNIIASQAGNGNYNAASNVIQLFTVNKANQTITFGALAAKTYGNAPFNLTATGGGSGNPITYISSDPLVATVSGITITIVGAGTCTITAAQAGNANYNAATDVPQTLTVNKVSQTITFNALAAKTYGNPTYTLSATGGASGNPITYSSSDLSVATISGNTVTIVGAGTTIITASQAGNSNYSAAADKPQNQLVNKAAQTITFNALANKAYGSADFNLTATGGGSGNTITYISSNLSVVTISGNTVTITGVGTTTITASQAGTSNYNAATNKTQNFTVIKGSQVITFGALTAKTYGDAPFNLTATGGGSGNPITYTSSNAAVATISGNTVTIVGAGSTNITASQAGNANYTAAANKVQNLTVKKAPQVIVFNPLPAKTYGDAAFALSATGGGSGNPVTFTSSSNTIATIAGNIVTIVNAGTINITAKQAGNANYFAATDVINPLVINKKDQTITFNALPTKGMGDPDFSAGATSSSGLAITYTSSATSVATVNYGNIHVIGAGTTIITAKQLGNNNYNPAPEKTQTFTVTRATQTITFNPIVPKTYGDIDFFPVLSVSSGLPVTFSTSDPAIATVLNGKIHITGAGTVNITASQAGNSSYEPAPNATQPLLINKADQSLTFTDPITKSYGEVDFYPGATISSGLAIEYSVDNPLVATVVNGKIHITGAGTAIITASHLGNTNYNAVVPIAQPLTVNKAVQSIHFGEILPVTFDRLDFSPAAIATSSLVVEYSTSNPAVATIVNGLIHITGVGSANIIAKQSGNINYLAANNESQLLIVNKAAQNITFLSLPAKTYGDSDFNLMASTNSGLPIVYSSNNLMVATVTGNIVHIVGAGIANIKATVSGNSNYLDALEKNQQLVVNRASQSIVFGIIPVKTFGDSDYDPAATASSGLSVNYLSGNTNVAVIVGNKVHIVGAGTATIYALQPGNIFYNPALFVSQTLTVNRASQSLVFNAIPIKSYSDPDFPPGAVSNVGLSIEYSSDNTNVAMIINGKIHIVGIGTANITASQGGSTNYWAAASLTQSLTVKKANQTIAFNALPSVAYGAADFNPGATSNSGLEISYSSSNTSVATIVNNKIRIIGAGIATIQATQPGNEYYNAAISKSQLLIVEKAIQTIAFSSLPAVHFGSSDFALEASSSSGLAVSFKGDNPYVATVVGGIVHITGTGSVTITAMQAGNTNYNQAVSISKILVIDKISQIIVLDTIPVKKYGDADFTPGAYSSSGLDVVYSSSNSNVAVILNGKIHITGAGTTIISTNQAGNINYNAAETIHKTFLVNKATILVKAENSIRNFQEANPVFGVTYTGFINSDNISTLDILPVVTTNALSSSYPGLYDLTPSGAFDSNYDFNYQKGILTIMGTFPMKPGVPVGNEELCINPSDQTYTTPGSVFATSYLWTITPSNAAIISGIGKTLSVNFAENYVGKVVFTVKGQNAYGISESSDSFYVHILDKPVQHQVSLNGSYCSNNPIGDCIYILNSIPYYHYQLLKEESPIDQILVGNGENISWGNLLAGKYSIEEMVCSEKIADNLLIKEVDPTVIKPVLELKWNDVLVCINGGDSVKIYNWYKDGQLIEGENKQYLWTQKTPGTYSVKAIDKSRCEFFSDEKIVELTNTGVIYPNPNKGQFKVSFSNSETGQVVIKISNMNSSPVKSYSFSKNEDAFEQEINIPDLKVGIYFIDVLLNGKRVFYEKLIRD